MVNRGRFAAASFSELRSSPALFSLDAVGSPKLLVIHMGVSENSVPLNPMVNDHYPY